MNTDTIMVSKLSSGRHILIVVNPSEVSCDYRYLSDKEIESESFDMYGIFDWTNTHIMTSVEENIAFIEVENQRIKLPTSLNTSINPLFRNHHLGRFTI